MHIFDIINEIHINARLYKLLDNCNLHYMYQYFNKLII